MKTNRKPQPVLFAFVVLLLFFLIIRGCFAVFSDKESARKAPSALELRLAHLPPANTAKYEIIKSDTDVNGHYNELTIYLRDTSGLRKTNETLFDGYRSDGIGSFTIYYFNNEHVAEIYKDAVLSDKIAESKLEAMEKHLIAKFYFDALSSEQHLYRGKDAAQN